MKPLLDCIDNGFVSETVQYYSTIGGIGSQYASSTYNMMGRTQYTCTVFQSRPLHVIQDSTTAMRGLYTLYQW